jgi:hypothetical protein
LRLWNVDTGALLRTFENNHDRMCIISSLANSIPDIASICLICPLPGSITSTDPDFPYALRLL